jgi:YesN/AraC family two-component response regulator
MLSILIVDDEKLARADILYKVSRSGFNFKWVMEASSAEEALDMIREHKPDILLADIMMGEMSGIELVREARTCSLDIVSILISGYSDFSYAKEAIVLNVVDYLLKPVRQDELNATLSNAIAKSMNQKNLIQFSVSNHNSMDELLSGQQKEQLHAILNGMETKHDFSVETLFPEQTKYIQIGLFHLSFAQRAVGTKEVDKPDYEQMRRLVKEIIQEIGGPWFLSIDNFAQKRQITVIAATPSSQRCKGRDALTRTYDEIYHQVCNRLDVILHIGLSGMVEASPDILMIQARQALDLRLSLECEGKGRIFHWDDCEKLATVNLPEEDFKLFKSFIAAGDLNQAIITVRRIFSSELPGTAQHIRMLYIELICILARTCIKKVGGSVVSMLGPECLGGGIIDQFSNREELIESLCRTITTALSCWMEVSGDTSTVLQNVKSYIENNYTSSQVCTNFLSNQFCISLGYLSTSYKKEFGVTISKNIISLRMDYARKLITETNLSILEVAENNGFNNLSYFMRTFKKHVGCTPTEFRNKSRRK